MGRHRKDGPRLRLRNGIYYATVYDGGVPVERSTGEHDRKVAEALARSWSDQTEAPRGDPSRPSATLNDALDALISDTRAKARLRSPERSLETVEFYECKAGTLLAFFGHAASLSLWTKDSSASWRYIEWRRQTEVSDRTIKKELGALRTALYRAKERGAFGGDPDLAVPSSFDAGSGISRRSPTREEFMALIPFLTPDAAAQAAFIVATSAEMAAVNRAKRSDLPARVKAPCRVEIRGSKTDDRQRLVPIVTDEQVMLLEFAKRHAQGVGDRLFGTEPPNRSLERASIKAKIAHVTPHSLRHAAGQWLLDLGTPIELVSRILGHASTSITEKVYARIKQEQVGDRMLDALDPQYTRAASRARKKSERKVPTLTRLPEPHVPEVHEVDGRALTLDAWARLSGIPKSTLYFRVVLNGITMKQALAMGRGSSQAGGTRVLATRSTAGILPGNSGNERPLLTHQPTAVSLKTPRKTVGQDRLELSANGLRVRCSTN